MTQVKIKENSWLAKIAARNLDSDKIAMVIGKTIHLYNSSKHEFLNDQRWVCHEVAHVKQYRELGFLKFIILYLLESFNKGYQNNKFEVEARRKERDVAILNGIHFV
jgi:hypothetical protein